MVGVDVRRLRAGQLAEAFELRRERPGGVPGLVDLRPVLDVMQPDRQRRVLACEPHGVGGRGPVDHQARAGEDAVRVRLDDALVDTGGEAEVIGVDDQPAHVQPRARASSGCSDGVHAQAAPRRRASPSTSSIVWSTE